MSISINQFLQADDFDIAENITFTPFNPDDLEDFGEMNFSTTEFIELEALDGLTESSAKADQSDQPFTPSFQPLNEAGVLTAGETLNKSAVGSTTNNSLGVQNSSMEFLGNTAAFNTETDFNLTEEAIAQIEEAQKTLATGTLGLANSLDLAEGGIRFSTTNMSFGATNILMGTEGTYHLAAPIVSTVAGVESRQAQTIQQTADLITDNSKNKVSQVEGLSSSIAANTMTTSLEGQISVSNYSTNTAVQKIVNTSNAVQNIGAEIVENRSKGTIANFADGAIATQGADISITASAGSKSSLGNGTKSLNPLEGGASFIDAGNGKADITTVDPTGKETTFKGVNQDPNFEAPPLWKQTGGAQGLESLAEAAPTSSSKGGGNISILSNDGNTTVISKKIVQSAAESIGQTAGGNIVSNAKGSNTISGNFANIESDVGTTVQASGYVRTQSGKTGTFIAQGFTFAGFKFPNIKKFIDQAKNNPLNIRSIPNLPELPKGITYQDLENCIPEKYKNPVDENLEEPVDNDEVIVSGNRPTQEEAGRREKQIAGSVGDTPGNITEQDGVDAATNSPKENRNNTNTVLSTNTAPSDQTTPSRPNEVIGAGGVVKGGVDIHTRDPLPSEDIYNREDQSIIDPDADEELNGPEFVTQAINVLSQQDVEDVVDTLSLDPIWITRVTPVLPNIKLFLREELLNETDLLPRDEQGREPSDLFSILVDQFGKQIIDELQETVIERASIGGLLGFVTKAYNSVKGNIGVVNDVINAANERNTFNVIRNTVTAASSVTDREIFSDLGNIIDSSASLSNLYGQVSGVITNPNATVGDIVDDINFGDVEAVINQGLQNIGIDNLQVAANIARILNNVKNSRDYQENGLSARVSLTIINQIAIETGITERDATQVYRQAEDVIRSILEGNVRDALLSSELTSVLGFFIGESNAALLTELQGLYFSGVNALGTIRDTVQTGRNIYNTVDNIYTQLKAVPALVGLMNDYEMPTLSQVTNVFKCFELIRQVNRIVDDIQDISENIGTLVDFGGDIADLFNLFGDTFGGGDEVTPLESISEGRATGNIVGSQPRSLNELNNVSNTTSTNNVQLDDIATINDAASNTTDTGSTVVGIPGEEEFVSSGDENISRDIVSPQVCLTSILDSTVDTNHSDNPSDWKSKRTELEAVDIIEKLPRLTQIFNSIRETPTTGQGIQNFLTEEQLQDLKTTRAVIPTNPCYLAPELNLLEASIEVIEIKENVLLYRMRAIDTLRLNNKNIFPTTNTIVQLYIERFFDNISGSELTVQRDRDFFSPLLYNFKTISFHRERNIGLAHLIATPNRIHLQNTNNVTYNYSITDIGKRLNPVILDSYIIA